MRVTAFLSLAGFGIAGVRASSYAPDKLTTVRSSPRSVVATEDPSVEEFCRDFQDQSGGQLEQCACDGQLFDRLTIVCQATQGIKVPFNNKAKVYPRVAFQLTNGIVMASESCFFLAEGYGTLCAHMAYGSDDGTPQPSVICSCEVKWSPTDCSGDYWDNISYPLHCENDEFEACKICKPCEGEGRAVVVDCSNVERPTGEGRYMTGKTPCVRTDTAAINLLKILHSGSGISASHFSMTLLVATSILIFY